MENIDLVKALIGLGGVALIVGLVQMIKPFVTETRWYPFIAVGFGLILNCGATYFLGATAGLDWFASMVNGSLAGLAASGLYEVAVDK